MSPQAGWLLQEEIVPRLRATIPQAVRCVGAEDPAELIQDATAMAARILHNSERAGKKVTAGNVAYYALQHARAGRRSTGYSAADVLASATQLRGRSRINSLEEVVVSNEETGGEMLLLHDVLGSSEEDPGTKAARKLDLEIFLAGLPDRERAALEFLMEGKTLREAARLLGLSDSAMQNTKRSLGAKFLDFMGPEILGDIQRRPQWRENLGATREKLACRHERAAA